MPRGIRRVVSFNTVALVMVSVMLAAGSVIARPQGERRDVLLVEHPENIAVLNHYEQTASTADRNLLTPFTPLVVVNEHATLSDGFTECIEVKSNAVPFYLLKDEHGWLPMNAGIRIVRGASMIEDTMRVAGKSPLPVTEERGGRARIPPGTLVERFFEQGGRTYVRSLAPGGSYGWIDRSGARSLAGVQESARAPGTSAASIEAIVRSRIDETNAVLRQLYRLFNAQTRSSLTVPAWTISVRPGVLLCELAHSRVAYDQSTRYLDNDMENALLGTGARLVESPGSIAVYLP